MSESEAPELTLEDVTQVNPTELDDNQTNFLRENIDNLSDEQKETYKDIIEQKSDEKDEEEIDVPDPEIRGTKVDKEQKPKSKKGEELEDEENEDEDEDVDPDDEKAISKIVDKRLKPINETLKEVQRLRDEAEVDGYLRAKPEFSKYRDTMLKYISHSAYKNIPVHNIAAIVASGELMKIGAKKEREAQRAVKESQTKGTQVRQPAKTFDWHNAKPEDVAAQRAKVLGHQG